MSDQENGCLFSNSAGSSRRSSNDSIDDNIRNLMGSCEGEEAGPLNSQDLSVSCDKFGFAENGLDEIMATMRNGRICGSDDPSDNRRSNEMNQHSSQDNFEDEGRVGEKAESSGQNQTKEKWERDSGMDETSGDPTLQQIMAAASNAKGPSRSSNFLELANTLHLAALGSLKTDMAEITTKLQHVKQERDSIRAALQRSTQERKDIIRDYEERLSTQAQQSEEHITELQSVIAELNKKLAQNSVDKIDELEEVEIESHTSERGSQSDSESLESSGPDDDEMDEEISKVVGDFGFAIEREKPANKETEKHGRRDGGKLKCTEEDGTGVKLGDTSGQTSKLVGEDKNPEENMRQKCSELQVRCLELEKKAQMLERQLQQTSLREYMSRKRSSDSTGATDIQELQVVLNERDGLRAKLQELEQVVEQIKTESAGFRNERDRLRKRLIEMQEQLKLLHQRSVQFENRVRSQSLESGTKSPRMMRANQSGSLPWDHRGNQLGGRTPSRQASSASSDVSSRDGMMTSPRICRRSSTDNLNTTGSTSRLGHSPGTPVKRPSVGPTLSPSESSHSLRHPSGSLPSVSSQTFSRPGVTSDYGSVHGSTQDITVLAKVVDEGLERGMTGGNCIIALSQLPEFASGKMPAGLVRALEGCRSAQEVYTSLFNFCDEQANKELKQYELDLERLTSRFDHLQAQNNVIARSLEESRDNAERLSVLMGKYESNNTALHLALNACDKTIEAYSVLLNLAELEQAGFILKCHAAGLKTGYQSCAKQSSQNKLICNEDADRDIANDSLDVETCLKRRHLVENDARALLYKLDRRFEQQGVTLPQGESNAARSRRSSSASSSNDVEFTRTEEARLRCYIERLRSERHTVGMTLIKLESITGIPEPKQVKEENFDPRLDLENAVLMQELMALKEEKAELKAKNYLVEKEKKALELRITSRDAKEQAYLVHIDHLKSEMQDEIKRRRKLQKENGVASSKSDDKSGTSSETPSITLAELRTTDEDIPSDLYEATKREKKLKARIQELVETLETLSKNSEVRHQQTAEYVSDLKKANGALVAAYEKAKKKHGARLRKLEQQMLTMVERHDKQVRTLKERTALMEEEIRGAPLKQNETAL